MSEIFETFLRSGKCDAKGRHIGYIVGLREMDDGVYAWVQNGRCIDGYFGNFGVIQRSRRFETMEQANRWAYKTAKERLAKLIK
jgi:hypothetical protein